jgi:transcriptional antiterminator NusG
MARQTGEQVTRWYVIHTYSGYEENVQSNLKQRIDSMEMQDKIFDVLVPKIKKIKIKNGKRKIVEEKIYPGYVLVKMILTDESWYVVRNTPNVTGFAGPSASPTPLSPQEVERLQKLMGMHEPTFTMDFSINMPVKVVDGPFKGLEGKIQALDESKGRVTVLINMLGRETPVELDSLQIKKL